MFSILNHYFSAQKCFLSLLTLPNFPVTEGKRVKTKIKKVMPLLHREI